MKSHTKKSYEKGHMEKYIAKENKVFSNMEEICVKLSTLQYHTSRKHANPLRDSLIHHRKQCTKQHVMCFAMLHGELMR